MTTAPNSEPASAVAEPAAGEAAHSDLVAKLVAEAFSGFSRGARPTATPAAPSEIPGGCRIARSFRQRTRVPPCRRCIRAHSPPRQNFRASASKKRRSGAHAPDSGDSYAFGEPRCNGDYRPKGKKPDTKTANGNPLLGLPGRGIRCHAGILFSARRQCFRQIAARLPVVSKERRADSEV